ncbi:MAG: FtsX-like permease family protein, partial [Gammaproteobacteria bacterium TMED92]
RLQLHDPLDAPTLIQQLAETSLSAEDGAAVSVSSWIDEYGDLFRAVAMEKTMMATLLLLVVAIAGFNIVAGQIMMVHDKRADIAILRTMGANQSLIRNMFLLQGLLVGLLGTTIGLGLGVLTATQVNEIVDGLELLTGQHLLDGSYFVEVPSRVESFDLALTAVAAATLTVWAAWVPARRASQLDPVANLQT